MENQVKTTGTPGLWIKNLCPALNEIGKIKIGEKGRETTSERGKKFQPPVKLDHFKVVGTDRGPDGNYLPDPDALAKYGDKPRELPIRLLYDNPELNFVCRFVRYQGRKLICQGDGEWAIEQQGIYKSPRVCPCGKESAEYKGPDKCKMLGTLGVFLEGIPRVGGVYKYRTSSYNTISSIMGSLRLIHRLTGGILSGVPLVLTVAPKHTTTPDGLATTVYVVGLEYRGSIDELQRTGLSIALQDGRRRAEIAAVEDRVRAELSSEAAFLGDPVETSEEFFPEAAFEGYDPMTGEVIDIEAAAQPQDEDKLQRAETAPPPAEPTRESMPKPSSELRNPASNRKLTFPTELESGKKIKTAGVKGAALDALARAWATALGKRCIQETMQVLGITQLAYLRQIEAEELIAKIERGDAAPDAAGVMLCPLSRASVSRAFCKGECMERARDGFCPHVDDVQPAEIPNA